VAEVAGSPDEEDKEEEGGLMCWTVNLLEARPPLPLKNGLELEKVESIRPETRADPTAKPLIL